MRNGGTGPVVAAIRVAPLVFVASVVQVAAIAGGRLFGAEPDLLLVTLVAIAMVSGSIEGAVSGFVGGLLVDVMTLGTLGVTSILLTLAGYGAGRYGETTGRGRAYAPSLAAFAITILVGLGGMALHYLLGEVVSARVVLGSLLQSGVLAALLVVPLERWCRVILQAPARTKGTREVELV